MITLFGSVAVMIMFLSYWMEHRSKWLVLVFAAGSAATSAYSALAAVYPITVIEAAWALVAIQRFVRRHRAEAQFDSTDEPPMIGRLRGRPPSGVCYNSQVPAHVRWGGAMALSFNTVPVERRNKGIAWISMNRPDQIDALGAGAAGRSGGERQRVFRGR